MNTYESIENRSCRTGRTGRTCQRQGCGGKVAKALVLGLILGYSAGVITYCWIHILTTVN